jgi:hypothetical protein
VHDDDRNEIMYDRNEALVDIISLLSSHFKHLLEIEPLQGRMANTFGQSFGRPYHGEFSDGLHGLQRVRRRRRHSVAAATRRLGVLYIPCKETALTSTHPFPKADSFLLYSTQAR